MQFYLIRSDGFDVGGGVEVELNPEKNLELETRLELGWEEDMVGDGGRDLLKGLCGEKRKYAKLIIASSTKVNIIMKQTEYIELIYTSLK